MDNYLQVARSGDGEYIFYSWTDTDTTLTGYMEPDNAVPNLRFCAQRISDGFRTCVFPLTEGDPLYDGQILWPSLAPVVLSNSTGIGAPDSCFRLPIVMSEMPGNNQFQPTFYYYFGNEATINVSDFADPTTLGGGWFATCTRNTCQTVGINPPAQESQAAGDPYPQPTEESVNLDLCLPSPGIVSARICDLSGKCWNLDDQSHPGGYASLHWELPPLPSGMYLIRVNQPGSTFVRRLQILH